MSGEHTPNSDHPQQALLVNLDSYWSTISGAFLLVYCTGWCCTVPGAGLLEHGNSWWVRNTLQTLTIHSQQSVSTFQLPILFNFKDSEHQAVGILENQCCGSVTFWSDSGSGSKSCYFCQWPSREQKICFFSLSFLAYYFLTLPTSFFKNKKS